MKLLYSGYYGYQNTGDDAFVEVTSWGARRFWNVEDNMYLARSLPIIKTEAKFQGTGKFKGHDFIKNFHSIYNCDGLILAGGSLFHSEIKTNSVVAMGVLRKRCSAKFRFGAIGVSLGPYTSINAEKKNIELLKRFDFLVLRDEESYKLAQEYNLPYDPIQGFDLAALLPAIYNEPYLVKANINAKKIIGISICNYESFIQKGDIENELRRNSEILTLLERIAMIDDEIVFRFFIFNGNDNYGDKNLTFSVIEKIRSKSNCEIEIIDYNPNVYSTWLKIQECNLMLATRLHAAIFACFTNIPFFLVEYHRKCSNFLHDIGYADNYRINDAFFDMNYLANTICSILNDELLYDKPKNVGNVINLSMKNFSETSKFFNVAKKR